MEIKEYIGKMTALCGAVKKECLTLLENLFIHPVSLAVLVFIVTAAIAQSGWFFIYPYEIFALPAILLLYFMLRRKNPPPVSFCLRFAFSYIQIFLILMLILLFLCIAIALIPMGMIALIFALAHVQPHLWAIVAKFLVVLICPFVVYALVHPIVTLKSFINSKSWVKVTVVSTLAFLFFMIWVTIEVLNFPNIKETFVLSKIEKQETLAPPDNIKIPSVDIIKRTGFTSYEMQNGKLLLFGGISKHQKHLLQKESVFLKNVDELDPKTGKIRTIGYIEVGRSSPSLLNLKDGNILIFNGRKASSGAKELEVFNIKTGKTELIFKTTPFGFYNAVGIALSDDTVLLTYEKSAFILDLRKNELRQIKGMLFQRYDHSMSLMPDGNVLISGGIRRSRNTPRFFTIESPDEIFVFNGKELSSSLMPRLFQAIRKKIFHINDGNYFQRGQQAGSST